MENISITEGTRIGIGGWLKPTCESTESSSLSPRICECCGKEHDGSFGSGRFCSLHCAQSNKTRKKVSHICEFCKLQLDSTKEYRSHLINCEYRDKLSPGPKPNNNWVCKYCSITFKSRKELYIHYKTCNKRLLHPLDSKGRIIGEYNRSQIVRTTIENKRLRGEKIGHPQTSETREKISRSRLRNLEIGKGNTWICPSIKRSYAEQYFFDSFINEGIEFSNNVWVGHYCLDFVVGKKYFEVDGEQHYTPSAIEKDIKREEFLLKKGYTLIGRCRWSEFSKFSFEKRKEYILSIIRLLTID